jgi:hypothetical protein
MPILLRPVFLLSLLFFFLDQLLEKCGVFIPYIHSYLDDICCMPVLLSLASASMSIIYFGKQSRNLVYTLSPVQIISALVYCIVLFEFVLPRYSAKYTADFWDIPAYIFGALIFIKFGQGKKKVSIV